MSKDRDRELGMFREISRRDFLNGVAVGAAAAESWLPGLAWADGDLAPQDKPGYYPPALTGLRGSHPGSFEDAHKLRDGNFWKSSGQPTDTGESYDLIIVGGGISGLAAAYFWRAQKPDARILILDNHDDFGGHAKRNEFRSEEHTSELQSRFDLVCRLLLEKKKLMVYCHFRLFLNPMRKLLCTYCPISSINTPWQGSFIYYTIMYP